MSDKFVEVEPLSVGGLAFSIEGTCAVLSQVDRAGPNVLIVDQGEARALRDWLNAALGDSHD